MLIYVTLESERKVRVYKMKNMKWVKKRLKKTKPVSNSVLCAPQSINIFLGFI